MQMSKKWTRASKGYRIFDWVIGLLLISCARNPPIENLYDEIPVDTLVIVDSIGVLFGDSAYMFSTISDYKPLPSGATAILDESTAQIRTYDSTGNHNMTFGRFGDGPGEFQMPSKFVQLGNSCWVVTDMLTGLINTYDSTGKYISRWNIGNSGFSAVTVLEIEPLDDSSFVSYNYTFLPIESGFVSKFNLSSYNAFTGEYLAEYFSWQGDIKPDMDEEVPYFSFTTDNDGHLYISRTDSDAWEILIYTSDGSVIDTLSLFSERERIPVDSDSTRIPGTYPITLSISGRDIHSGLPERHPYISALGCDSNGNIWARRGGPAPSVWDVVSPDGIYLKAVIVRNSRTADYLDIHINSHGMLGIDPDGWLSSDYTRIYRMAFK